jgi:hypothetical protein
MIEESGTGGRHHRLDRFQVSDQSRWPDASAQYNSATGSTSENENLAFVAGEVRKRTMTVQAKDLSLATLDDDNASDALEDDEEKSVDSVVKKRRLIADELLALLSSLQAAQRKSSTSTWA